MAIPGVSGRRPLVELADVGWLKYPVFGSLLPFSIGLATYLWALKPWLFVSASGELGLEVDLRPELPAA
jgi:hypothetical protein